MSINRALLFTIIMLISASPVLADLTEEVHKEKAGETEAAGATQEDTSLNAEETNQANLPAIEKPLMSGQQAAPTDEIKSLKGEIIDIDRDHLCVTVKAYMNARGIMFESTIFDRVTLYFDEQSIFKGGYNFKDFHDLQNGHRVEAVYKRNKVGENMVKEISQIKQ